MSGVPDRPPVELTEAFLRSLPKSDLHVHLDGSLRLETILDLAEEQKVKLPAGDADGLRRAVVKTPENCRSLVEYLEAFEVTLSVLQQREALTRAAFELAEDCARENVRYFECRYSPILHQKQGLSLPSIVEAVVEGLEEAERKFGIKSGVIICGIRSLDPSVSFRLAELTVAFKDRGVVGFDLAGAEADYPAKDHRQAFYLILNNNINCTVHAGESFGPESIHQAIHYCGAHRIGHGVRLLEDASLMAYVNDHRIPIECCITSNVQTHTVPDVASHPLGFYHDLGLRVTVNTDNRLISDTTLTRELELCVRHLGFGAEGIRELIIDGFKSAFLPFHERRRMLRAVVQELDGLFGDSTIARL
jgi:adenosine deaminase